MKKILIIISFLMLVITVSSAWGNVVLSNITATPPSPVLASSNPNCSTIVGNISNLSNISTISNWYINNEIYDCGINILNVANNTVLNSTFSFINYIQGGDTLSCRICFNYSSAKCFNLTLPNCIRYDFEVDGVGGYPCYRPPSGDDSGGLNYPTSFADIKEVFLGGGSAGDVMRSYNPTAYDQLTLELSNFFVNDSLNDFGDKTFNLLRLLIMYILRQPATLMPLTTTM